MENYFIVSALVKSANGVLPQQDIIKTENAFINKKHYVQILRKTMGRAFMQTDDVTIVNVFGITEEQFLQFIKGNEKEEMDNLIIW